MKKLFGLVGLAGVLLVPTLQAAMQQVMLLDDTSKYSYSNGGEFRAVGNSALNSAVNWSAYSSSSTKNTTGTINGGQQYFQTFCIEYNEEFYPNTTYNVSISQNAKYGSQPDPGDPISIGTAWLYSTFASGTLSDYNYTYGAGRQSNTSAGALQQAIWWLEGENLGVTGVRNSFIDTAEVALYGSGHTGGIYDDKIKTDANGAYGVRALNLGDPGLVQDQLVIVPEPTTMIAGALLLLPFGASAIRILRRKA